MKDTTPTDLMLKCTCHGEALQVTHWPEKDAPDEFWFSIWQQGFDSRLCWRQRFRWCWSILRTGKPWADNIILTPEQASEVAQFIEKHQNVKETAR